jgi:4-amino-4-deoxy-L-arabinose transferase-like glycosyltransferase
LLNSSRGALLAIPVVWALLFFNLGAVGLLGPDEPRYAAIGRAMHKTGDFITPTLWGAPWLEKPALLYWLIALGHRVGLPDDVAPRLPIALVSLAFGWFYFFWLRREFGAAIALYATAILYTCAGWVAYSSLALADLPLTACFSVAMLLGLPWAVRGERERLPWIGVALGGAALAKGLVPLVLVLPLVWFTRSRWREWWRVLGPAAAVALPWFALCWWRNGWRFIEVFFIEHHFRRFFSGELLHAQPFWYYVPVLCGALLPWTPLLAGLTARPLYEDQRARYLGVWLAFGFVFFSASSGKLPGYLLPLLPAAAILLAMVAEGWFGAHWALVAAAALTGLVPVAAAVLPDAVANGLTRASFAGWEVGLAVAVGAALLAALREWQANRTSTVLLVALLATLGIVYVKRTAYPVLEERVSAGALWRSVEARRSQICLGNMHRNWRYGLQYYAGAPLVDCLLEEKPLRLEQREGDGMPRLWGR